MKIELDNIGNTKNRIDAYARGQVTVAGKVYRASLLLSADAIVPTWSPQQFTDLSTGDIEQIITLAPEIVIIGTGEQLIFPDEALLKPLRERAVGIEIMDTGAACRSYNFLLGEGRHVVAALLMIAPC